MGRVATGTGRCHDQTLEKIFTVDAFRIIGGDVMLRSLVENSRFLAFPMTTAAKHRHIGRIAGRLKVRMGQNPVSTMAILA